MHSPPEAHERLPSLDWLNFFVANLQTGFGPFVAVYLTTQKWTQFEIGIAFSVGSFVGILGQVPAGVLVDAIPRKRLAAGIALSMIAASAVLMAVLPVQLPVFTAQALHAFASCVLVPAVAAMTLNRVGHDAVAVRLGRNARFQALGNAAGAALMGAIGSWLSSQAVFFVAALMCLPALAAVRSIGPRAAHPAAPEPPKPTEGWDVLWDRRLLAFAACGVAFQLANAAMLPLAAAEVTRTAGNAANAVIALCLVVPQAVVALVSPAVGRAAGRWGRRGVLLIGFMALPLRGVLLSSFADPGLITATQALDGVGGAVFGVLVPLVAADVAGHHGRFNLAFNTVGLAMGLGATLSTAMAGAVASDMGTRAAFLALAFAGMLAALLALAVMPETEPRLSGHSGEGRPSPAA